MPTRSPRPPAAARSPIAAHAPPAGLLVSAPASRAGKTTLTLGLLGAFRRAGVRVQPCKCGPDYIDPAFHAAASGRDSVNLDSWAMRAQTLRSLVANCARASDLVLCEGAMGLFDGVTDRGACGSGASADIATMFGWPVLLVLDVSGQAQTAGAVAKGCASFRDGVQIGGVILNNVASPRHERLAVAGVRDAGLDVLGACPRDKGLTLPERHLGLVQASETADLARRLERLADFVAAHVDLAGVRAMAGATLGLPSPAPTLPDERRTPPLPWVPALQAPGLRIALAQDAAFSFLYPHVVAGWLAQGARVIPFSPLRDEPPDPGADAVWLPGGYPELHAERLAAAERFLDGLRKLAGRVPIHGECGGFMVLGEGIETAEGRRCAMAGLLRVATSFKNRRMQLGYRRAALMADGVLGPKGTVIRGHEFHYATLARCDEAPFAAVVDASGVAIEAGGARAGLTSGTFFHAIDRAE